MHWLTFLLVEHASFGNPSFLIYGSIQPLLRGNPSCLSRGNRRQLLLYLPNLASNSPLIKSSAEIAMDMKYFHPVEVPMYLGEQDGHCVFCPDSGLWNIHKIISVPKQGEKET